MANTAGDCVDYLRTIVDYVDIWTKASRCGLVHPRTPMSRHGGVQRKLLGVSTPPVALCQGTLVVAHPSARATHVIDWCYIRVVDPDRRWLKRG